MINLSIRSFCLSVIVVFISLHGYTQNLDRLNSTNVVPPSPEVAALAKFIEMPVGYSTGTAQVSVPLYTVKSGGIELPVSLNYNASGIKVEEVATWVGLGWNLSAGGSVSRMVRGQPDDYSSQGYMYTSKTAKYILSLPLESTERFNILYNNAQFGELDVEPDIYFFSAMGYSGKFYFDQQLRKFVTTPYQLIRIEHATDVNNKIKSFTLTLPNGIKCYFGISADGLRTAYETYNSQNTTVVSSGTYSHGTPDNTPSHITNWQLMETVSPTNKSVKLFYTNYLAVDFGRGGESTDHAGMSGCAAATGYNNASYYTQFSTKSALQKISFDLGDVYFIRSPFYRQDVLGDQKALDSVIVRDKNQKRIKAFRLSYDYITRPDTLTISNFSDQSLVEDKRLFLKSIREINADNTANPPYEFTYNTDNLLPSRLSASQDYWGYYNGKSNGDFLTPKISISLLYGGAAGAPYFPGADRTIGTEYMKAGILTKVKYPTGGFSDYFYEGNIAPVSFLSLANGFIESGLTDKMLFLPKSTEYQLPLDPKTYEKTFTVTNPIGTANVTAAFETCADFNSVDCRVQGTIVGITDPGFSYSIAANQAYTTLPAGQYKARVKLINLGLGDPEPDFSLTILWSEDPDPDNFMVGGLRVKKIINSDNFGQTIVKSLVYKKIANASYSSGVLYNLPTNAFKVFCGTGGEVSPSVLKVVSNSALSGTSLDGELIRYTDITEYSDENNTSFKTEYTFSADMDYVAAGNTNYPFPTPVQRDWRSGLLLNKKQFEKQAPGSYRIVAEEATDYASHQILYKDTFGIKISSYPTPNTFGYTPYRFVSEWYLPDSSSSTAYSYQGGQTKSVISSSKYIYNESFALALTRSVDSKGKVIVKRTWYPYDYTDIPGTAIADLKQKYIIDIPVKEESSVNGKLTGGAVIAYNTVGLPVAGYAYENAVLSDAIAHNSGVLIPSNYALKSSLYYNNQGRIVKSVTSGNDVSSFIWDYSGEYPIAKIAGADTSTVAYTSFEADGKGGWSFSGSITADISSPTGAKCYNASGGITKTALTNGTYIVSYWGKTGSVNVNGSGPSRTGKTIGGWTYYEHELSGTSITISGGNYIDELRLYPKGAQMKTYTYKPLIGISTECDVNNKIIYYEYDSFNRLNLVRDQDKNILKRICYNYAGQPEDCVVNTNPLWQSTGSTRCQPCPANGAYSSNVQEHQEKDNNPYSSTYNTNRWVSDGVSGSCVPPADWQTNSALKCQLDGNGENTGYQVYTQKDMNPCSATYNQERTVVNGYNAVACPIPCNSSNCNGNNKKCINGVCETGTDIVIVSVRERVLIDGVFVTKWACLHKYCFSDGSLSTYSYSTYHDNACTVGSCF